MDFFNKLGEKAGEAYESVKNSDVTKKAVNYASIPSLSIQIGQQEAEIKRQYEIIGAAVFAAEGNDENHDCAEQFEAIKVAQKKIEELRAKIEEKKNAGGGQTKEAPTTKICPDCGKELGEESLFCSKCGHKFNDIVVVDAQDVSEE